MLKQAWHFQCLIYFDACIQLSKHTLLATGGGGGHKKELLCSAHQQHMRMCVFQCI